MSHPITMNWTNGTGNALSFANPAAREGTDPSANPTLMRANGTSAVSADQKGNLKAGPVGSYTWQNAADANQFVTCNYIHPAGKGETSVTVNCSHEYQVSDNNATWGQSQTYGKDVASLQQHAAQITLYIRARPA